MLAHLAGDGGKKARFTRKSTKETVKAIAQGMPASSGEPVVTTLVCFLFSHARLWVHLAPGIPCALCLSRDEVVAMTRARTTPREGKIFSAVVPGWSQRV